MVHKVVTTTDLQTKNTENTSPLGDNLIGALPGTQLLERYRLSKTVLINVNKCIIRRSQSRYYMKFLANLNSYKPKGHSLGS